MRQINFLPISHCHYERNFLVEKQINVSDSSFNFPVYFSFATWRRFLGCCSDGWLMEAIFCKKLFETVNLKILSFDFSKKNIQGVIHLQIYFFTASQFTSCFHSYHKIDFHSNENCRKICLFKFSSSRNSAYIDADVYVRVMHQPDNLIKRTMTFSEWEKLEKGKLNLHSRQDDFRVLRVLPDVYGKFCIFFHSRLCVFTCDSLIRMEKKFNPFQTQPIIISTITDEPKWSFLFFETPISTIEIEWCAF